MFDRKRTKEMHIYITDPFPTVIKEISYFMHGTRTRSHNNNYSFCFRMTIIIEKFIGTSGKVFKLLHCFFYNLRYLLIKTIASFTALEKHIRILCSTANMRMVRVH